MAFLGLGASRPRVVNPAPFMGNYVPLAMIFGADRFEPEHFLDIKSLKTYRVGDKGNYIQTGDANQWGSDMTDVIKKWIEENATPGSDEAKKKQEEAALKEVKAASLRKGRASTVLTSPTGLLTSGTETNQPTLLGSG
jgi:hypothetical protein